VTGAGPDPAGFSQSLGPNPGLNAISGLEPDWINPEQMGRSRFGSSCKSGCGSGRIDFTRSQASTMRTFIQPGPMSKKSGSQKDIIARKLPPLKRQECPQFIKKYHCF